MPRIVAILWMIFQPLLFGLIGAEVDILQIDRDTVGMYIPNIIHAIRPGLSRTVPEFDTLSRHPGKYEIVLEILKQ